MADTFTSQLRPAAAALVALTILTGVLYPLLVTAVAQVAFPRQANGSQIVLEGAAGPRSIGSDLIGQPFDDPGYFWTRPSATAPAFNGAASSGSNLGPTNPALIEAVRARIVALRAGDPSDARPVPVDLITASGSGLDPHISPAAAEYQVARIARFRKVAPTMVEDLVRKRIEPRQLGILGERRVNVLELNLDLDTFAPRLEPAPAGVRSGRG
jgi:K+-transporting ATPase ATPase C chain